MPYSISHTNIHRECYTAYVIVGLNIIFQSRRRRLIVLVVSSSWWLRMEIWISINNIRRQTWRNKTRSSSSPGWFPSAFLWCLWLVSVVDFLKRLNFTEFLNLFMFVCCRRYELISIFVPFKEFGLVFTWIFGDLIWNDLILDSKSYTLLSCIW